MEVGKAPNYDILYTDPPWENRMVKWFETKMAKDTGAMRPQNDIDSILNKLSLLADTEKPCFVEYGQRGFERVIQQMENSGHKCMQCVARLQKNNSPFVIMAFNANVEIPNLQGFDIVTAIVKNFKSPIVWDPFAGIGATRKAVEAGGGKYIGYEMNKARFDKMNYEN